MKTTTLNKIRRFSPCEPSWVKLLKSLNKTQADDEELSFRHIYETLGTLDTFWCLRTLDDLSYCVKIAKYAVAVAAADAADADAADDAAHAAAYAAARARDAAAHAAALGYAATGAAKAAYVAKYAGAARAADAALGYADAAAYAARATTYDAATRKANYDDALNKIGDHLMKLLEN